MDFSYYVNVDNPTRRVTVHVQGCVFVDEFGKGSSTGLWRPFDGEDTEARAYAYARKFTAPNWTVKTGDCCIRKGEL